MTPRPFPHGTPSEVPVPGRHAAAWIVRSENDDAARVFVGAEDLPTDRILEIANRDVPGSFASVQRVVSGVIGLDPALYGRGDQAMLRGCPTVGQGRRTEPLDSGAVIEKELGTDCSGFARTEVWLIRGQDGHANLAVLPTGGDSFKVRDIYTHDAATAYSVIAVTGGSFLVGDPGMPAAPGFNLHVGKERMFASDARPTPPAGRA